MNHRWSPTCTRFVGSAWLVLLASLFVSTPADAAPIFWSRTMVQLNNGFYGGYADPVDTGQVFGTDTLAPTELTYNVLGSAYGAASVTDGALRASVNAVGIPGDPGIPNSSGGAALAQFFDTFTPVSETLVAGTVVNLRIDWELTYSLAGDGCTDQALVYGGITVGGSILKSGQPWAGASRLLQDGTCPTSDFEVNQGDLQVIIGQEFVAEAFLWAMTGGVGATSANAGNTLRLVVTPLDDFSLQTASGNTYKPSQVAPVPEPVTLVLFGTSLLALATRRCLRPRNVNRGPRPLAPIPPQR